jgi:uncharacterized membrane protein YeiB
MPKRLVRLYPRRWRARYGDELEQLIHDLQPSTSRTRLAVDLVRGALNAYVEEALAMRAADRIAIKRGLLVALIVWAVLSTGILFTTVVFPSKTDDDLIPILLSYVCVFAALIQTGAIAARAGASRKVQLLAGLIAGVVIGASMVITFLIVDNVWLDIVARQPTRIDGFAHSGAASMRSYINQGLIGPGVFFTAAFGVFGALLSLAGGLVGAKPTRSPAATR